jgi:hypothetical protein
MRFEVYCDESRHDLLSSEREPKEGLVLIGGLWIRAEIRKQLKETVRSLRRAHTTWGEIKWNSVSASRLDFYRGVVDLFFDSDARFRCIAIDSGKVDLVKYHQADHELGFYKFYYQLLHHWIRDFNEYAIFVDFKTNRLPNRLQTLHKVLSAANITSRISCVQALTSRECTLIQLADFLTGAVGYKLHGLSTSSAKTAIVQRIEERLGRPIQSTGPFEVKFNVFLIDLQGGW